MFMFNNDFLRNNLIMFESLRVFNYMYIVLVLVIILYNLRFIYMYKKS